MTRRQTVLEYGWCFQGSDVPGGEKASCDTAEWREISLPHDWAVSRHLNREMAQGGPQGFLDRWGIGWYRLSLSLDAVSPDMDYLLTFEGVFENCTVWVNGEQAGGHLYGYSGFTLDVTRQLKAGENLIAVRVDNTVTPVCRWYSGAGIYRPVVLTEVSRLRLDEMELVVQTTLNDSLNRAAISVDTGICAPIRAVLLDSGREVAAAAGEGRTVLSLDNPKLWSADSPHLYTLEVSLMEGDIPLDSITLHHGVRKVAFVPQKGLFVNGERAVFKGVCLHHDVAGVGSAVTKSLLRQRLAVLKEIGCNAIRTSHNIPSCDLLDLCDEMGFYVLDESFDKWDTGAYERYFASQWESDLTYMVKRDRNRACVVLWSVGNEVDSQGSAHMLALLDMLVAKVRKLDGRPVTCALSPHYSDAQGNSTPRIEQSIHSINAIAKCVDIMGLNYQEQWYEDFHRDNPDQLIVGTETYLFFRGSRYNHFNFGTRNPWMDVEENDYVIGGFLWAGVDYLGESMGYPCKGWCGAMVKSNNERKPISWLFESYWRDAPMVHITVQDYSIRDDMEREHWTTPRMLDTWNFPMYGRSPIPYLIFSNCEEVRLSLNGKEYETARPADCESRIINGFLPMDKGTVTAQGLIGGKVVCEHCLRTAEPSSKLVFDAEKQHLAAGETRQVLLSVHAADRDGIRNMRECGKVRFVVEGDCSIEGVDNGDMLNTEPYAGDQVHLCHGAASVILRTRPTPGRIVVHAYCDGLLDGRAELILE